MLLDFTHVVQEDYNSTNFAVTFSPDESEKIIMVPILDDLSRERFETFYGILVISHQSEHLAKVITAEAVIIISYSDCKWPY